MTAKRVFTKFFKYHQLLGSVNSSRTFCTIYDKNFDYFRSKNEYKNTVVQLHSELNQFNFAGPGCSFVLKEHGLKTEGYFTHLIQRENVMKLSPEQVKDMLFLMANIKIDTVQYSTILRYLDEKCALGVERWPVDLSLFILDAWFIIWGPKAFRKLYYSALTSLWGRRIKKCSKGNLILMLYFIGMSKVSPPFLMELIEDRMESFITKFSDEELAIACLSFFKTSKRLKSKLLLQESCKAARRLLEKDDRFNAISILKCLRLSKHYDAELWACIKEYIKKQSDTFNFVECTNFLAVLAAQNIYEEGLFDVLEAQGCSTLLNEEQTFKETGLEFNLKTHPSLRSRVKDIARFAWAMGSVGHAIRKDTLDFMNDRMQQRNEAGEFADQMHVLVDYLQSLALVGCYPRGTLQSVLNVATLKKVYSSERAKPKYQLYFVQRSTQIEEPELEIDIRNLFNPIPKSLDRDVRERQGFQDMIDILRNMPRIYMKICYLIPHIMISGIIIGTKMNNQTEDIERSFNVYQKYLNTGILSKQAKDIFKSDRDYICVEILDPTVCSNDCMPLGLMKTKIRQLEKLNFKVVQLSPENISHLVKKNISERCLNINELFELK